MFNRILSRSIVIPLLGFFFIGSIFSQADVSVVFHKIYTSSVEYILTNLDPSLITQTCDVYVNNTGSRISCQFGSCSCQKGVLIGFSPNTINNLAFKQASTQVQLVSSSVKTASIGNISHSVGIDFISYEIEFHLDEVISSSCDVLLTQIDTETPSSIKGEFEYPCLRGTFNGLKSDTGYLLDIRSNGTLIHNVNRRTGYFKFSIIDTGVSHLNFTAQTNVEVESTDTCELTDSQSKQTVQCSGVNCVCLGDTITTLNPNTNYSIQFKKNSHNFGVFRFLTASTGEISFGIDLNELNFKVTYPEYVTIPTNCGFCYKLSSEGNTEAACRESVPKEYFGSSRCKSFYFYNGVPRANYDIYLFDKGIEIVSSLKNVPFPITQITQTSQEITSINYQMHSDLIDPNALCTFEDYYYKAVECLVNGEKKFDCPCDEGKLVGVVAYSGHTYVWIDALQNYRRVAYNSTLLLAKSGTMSEKSIGIRNFNFKITYSTYTLPPSVCSGCVIPLENGTKDCTNYKPTKSKEFCQGGNFRDLVEGKEYNLLIFDADMEVHTDLTFFTGDYPTENEVKIQNGVISYHLTYKSEDVIPKKCMIYFKDARNIRVSCDPKCTCTNGGILIPKDNQGLQSFTIEDPFGVEIFSTTIQSKLTAGPIIGIVIAVLVVLIVIIVVSVVVVRKRTPSTYHTSYQ